MFLVSVKPRLMLVFISVTLEMLVEAFKGKKSLKRDYIFTIYFKLLKESYAHSCGYVALNLVSSPLVLALCSQMEGKVRPQ